MKAGPKGGPSKIDKCTELELKHLWLDRVTAQSRLKGVPFLFRLIETGGRMPDVFFVHKGRSGWLEFKVTYNIKEPIVRYEPGQRTELRDLCASGVFAATLAVTSGMDFIIAMAPRVLCNTASTSLNLNSSSVSVKGFIEDANDALDWMLRKYYDKKM